MIRLLLGAALAVLVSAPAAGAAPPPKTLHLGDAGGTVTLVEHQRLRIRLKECQSCGYAWRTTRPPGLDVLRRLPSRIDDRDACDGCAGGSVTRVFRYEARHRGRTSLRLGYFPPGGQDPERAFRLEVRVRPQRSGG